MNERIWNKLVFTGIKSKAVNRMNLIVESDMFIQTKKRDIITSLSLSLFLHCRFRKKPTINHCIPILYKAPQHHSNPCNNCWIQGYADPIHIVHGLTCGVAQADDQLALGERNSTWLKLWLSLNTALKSNSSKVEGWNPFVFIFTAGRTLALVLQHI